MLPPRRPIGSCVRGQVLGSICILGQVMVLTVSKTPIGATENKAFPSAPRSIYRSNSGQVIVSIAPLCDWDHKMADWNHKVAAGGGGGGISLKA